jgi:hypothetical protein
MNGEDIHKVMELAHAFRQPCKENYDSRSVELGKGRYTFYSVDAAMAWLTANGQQIEDEKVPGQ